MPRRSRNVHTPTACLIVVTLVLLTGLSAHPQEPPCEPVFTMSLTDSKVLKWTVLDDEARRELLDLLYKEVPPSRQGVPIVRGTGADCRGSGAISPLRPSLRGVPLS